MRYGAIEEMVPSATPEDKSNLSRILRRRTGHPLGRNGRIGSVLNDVLKPKHSIRREQQAMLEIECTNSQFPPNDCKKSFMYTMLNPRSNSWQARIFKWFITTVIVIDLAFFVFSTEPDLPEKQVELCYHAEGITSTIFLLEYMARLVTVTEAKKYKEKGPILGRLTYMITIPALIDLVATVPFYLEILSGWNLPTLTYLRAFRLLRILKTSGFSEATKSVYRVIYYNRQILWVALLICVGLVLVTAVLMYYLRPRHEKYSQDFKSLGSTMYLSTLMLTGQGGPDGDLPWYTKAIVLLTGVFSIGMFAIPASMLTWGFEAEAERVAKLAYTHNHNKGSNLCFTDYDTWSYSSEDYSTDEEYFKIIAGADEEDDDNDEEDVESKKAMTYFFDSSKGSMPLSELLASTRSERGEAKAIKSTVSESRLSALEVKVQENSQKLDKILLILNGLQNQKNGK